MVYVNVSDELLNEAKKIAYKKFSFLLRNKKLLRKIEKYKKIGRMKNKSIIVNLIIAEWVNLNKTTRDEIYAL
ncbi:MAG: hypothetical protein QXW34_02200 [Candidatus Methanomethyliaceae archaeon]